MKAYLSGPMYGYHDDNEDAFSSAAFALREQGWDVFSPREYTEADFVPHGVLKAGLRKLLDCDHLIALPGWQDSRGCLLELATALLCGIKIMTLEGGELVDQPAVQMRDIADLIRRQDDRYHAT